MGDNNFDPDYEEDADKESVLGELSSSSPGIEHTGEESQALTMHAVQSRVKKQKHPNQTAQGSERVLGSKGTAFFANTLLQQGNVINVGKCEPTGTPTKQKEKPKHSFRC